ncbi:glycosyltransferase family 4 protein [Jeotgalibaca sp. A127]|uniref:glycosyltransferase family 4 protein n=1 Tax=Jeotgalibaca sp. A127 TaxID=3457324 RepID=UPI003FD18C68
MIIVHVEDYFDPTAGYQINELLIAGKEFNDEVYLITSKDMSPFHKNISRDADRDFEVKTGVKVIRLESYFKVSSRILLKKLFKIIDKINPDVVYMHGIGDFKDLILFRKKRKYSIIRDCHMSWVASQNKFRVLYYKLFKIFFATIINRTEKYNKIFALGDEEYQYLIALGISPKKIDFLKHGYNENVMFLDEMSREKIRQHYEYKGKDIVVAYIGKFDDFKRPDILFDIVNCLDENLIDKHQIKLLFIGPKDTKYMDEIFNPKMDKIKSKINITIDSSKSFSELRMYYSASDICIFPKETSLSSIHAQVCGCPVIMEDHSSNRERVINNNNLFSLNNTASAAKILTRIIEESEYKKDNNFHIYESLSDREYKNQIAKLRTLFNT